MSRKTASRCRGGRAKSGRREVDREPDLAVWAPLKEPDKRQGSFERERERERDPQRHTKKELG